MVTFSWLNKIVDNNKVSGSKIVLGHDTNEVRSECFGKYNFKVGQNCGMVGGSYSDNTTPAKEIINHWYNEVKDMNKAEVSNFQGGALSSGVSGHYTQVVWAATKTVGCAEGQLYKNGMDQRVSVSNQNPVGLKPLFSSSWSATMDLAAT